MRKTAAFIISLAMILSMAACSNSVNTDSSSSVSLTEKINEPEPARLINKMTPDELKSIRKHGLTILDKPEHENIQTESDEQSEHKVCAEFHNVTREEALSSLEGYRELLSEEDYYDQLEYIESITDEYVYSYAGYILVDDHLINNIVPYSDPGYDGGSIQITTGNIDENGQYNYEEKNFLNYDEYFDWLRKYYADQGYSDEETEKEILYIKIADEAFKTGNYEILPDGTVEPEDYYVAQTFDRNADHRDVWEFDHDAVEKIKDSIEEIEIYDAELNKDFTVHVTLPPEYDKEKSYPVFFLTDGVWRFGDHTKLRSVIENEQASPVILVSLGYAYYIDGTDETNRYNDLVINRDKLLDFITDNLMPYLCENYNIDPADSTLYGHSDGGVFAHYALFRSDMYDNQPFDRYIIGSPALWGLYNYNNSFNIDSSDCINDYGYFDRNEKLNKKVFLCAGSLEDPDYADKYDGHDTTLEGAEKLKNRLESHNADLTYRLYESHHYQYIPEMLIEYLKENYPV